MTEPEVVPAWRDQGFRLVPAAWVGRLAGLRLDWRAVLVSVEQVRAVDGIGESRFGELRQPEVVPMWRDQDFRLVPVALAWGGTPVGLRLGWWAVLVTVEQLRDVDGIGESKFGKLREQVSVG